MYHENAENAVIPWIRNINMCLDESRVVIKRKKAHQQHQKQRHNESATSESKKSPQKDPSPRAEIHIGSTRAAIRPCGRSLIPTTADPPEERCKNIQGARANVEPVQIFLTAGTHTIVDFLITPWPYPQTTAIHATPRNYANSLTR